MRKVTTMIIATLMATGTFAGNILTRQAVKPTQTADTGKWAATYNNEEGRANVITTGVRKVAGINKIPAIYTGDMDPKRLTYVAPDNYFYLNELQCVTLAGKFEMYSHFTAGMTNRFKGNKLKTINIIIGSEIASAKVIVRNAAFEKIFEQEATLDASSSDWGYAVSIPTDIDITGEDIYVGYYAELTEGKKFYRMLLQGGRVNENSMLEDVFDNTGYKDMSSAYAGVPFIWCDTEGDNGLYANDVAINSVSGVRTKLGEQYFVTGSFTNMGTSPVEAITVSYQMADGTTKEEVLNAGDALPYMNRIYFNLPITADYKPGIFDRELTVTAINGKADDYPEDNTGTSKLFAIDKPVDRKIVIEEFTGTWCGYCPRGIEAMRMLQTMYGDKVVPMELHYNDEFSYESGDNDDYNTLGPKIPGFPQAFVNHTTMCDPWAGGYDNAAFGMGELVGEKLNEPVEVSVALDLKLSDDKQTITATSTTTCSLEVDEASRFYKLGYVLLESGLNALQTNYNSGAFERHPCTRDELHENMKKYFDRDYYYDETYDHVVRAEFGTQGIDGSLTGAVAVGGTLTNSIDIPTDALLSDTDHASVAVFVIDAVTNEILNADIAHINPEVAGISNIKSETMGDMEYFSLTGMKLNANNLPKGMIVVKNGNKTFKTVNR